MQYNISHSVSHTAKKNPRYFVNSLAKGLAILNVLGKQTSPLGLAEIARLSRMNLPTASRYLRTLTDMGYLVQNSYTKKYLLTNKVMALGLSFVSNMDLVSRVNPYLINISREFRISTNCVILDDIEVVFIGRVRGPGPLDFNLTIGSRLPAYCTALGRAILAYLDPKELSLLFSKMDLKARTSYTLTCKNALQLELEKTRKRGYAQNFQELNLGYGNFAVPIFNYKKVEAAIGVTFSLDALNDVKFVNSLKQNLIKAAEEVSIGSDNR